MSKYRLSQTVCTVTTVYVTCTQMALWMDENLCTVLIPLCKNNFESANLPHRPLCSKKIRTTTTTSSSESLQSQYSIRSSIFPIHYLKFQTGLIDLSQSGIQILYGLQIDNGIRQCVNSSWTGIFENMFVVYGQYIRLRLDLQHRFSFQFIKISCRKKCNLWSPEIQIVVFQMLATFLMMILLSLRMWNRWDWKR